MQKLINVKAKNCKMELHIINKLGIFFIFVLLMLSACSQDETSINVLNPIIENNTIIENTTQSTTDNC